MDLSLHSNRKGKKGMHTSSLLLPRPIPFLEPSPPPPTYPPFPEKTKMKTTKDPPSQPNFQHSLLQPVTSDHPSLPPSPEHCSTTT
ncbi:hypothetical protein VTJ04DRAFT_3153 [Mycothermus thermophilus]|uniref:uncharacterized protein n=1 Tax=Humicola insolens TaxID=85995 RepID=UPI0037425B65